MTPWPANLALSAVLQGLLLVIQGRVAGGLSYGELLEDAPVVAPLLLPELSQPLTSGPFHWLWSRNLDLAQGGSEEFEEFASQMKPICRSYDPCRRLQERQANPGLATGIDPLMMMCLQCLVIAQTDIHEEDDSVTCAAESEVKQHCSDVEPGRFCPMLPKAYPGEAMTPFNELDEGQMMYCIFWANNETGKAVVSLPCPPNFFCPGKGESPTSCAKGWYCPGGTAEELPCPEGSFCLLPAMNVSCLYDEHHYNYTKFFVGAACGNGTERITLPRPCPVGYHCRDGVMYECEIGYVCPGGSAAPVKCTGSDLCTDPRMEKADRNVSSAVFSAFFLALSVLLIMKLEAVLELPKVVQLGIGIGTLAIAWLYEFSRMSLEEDTEMFVDHCYFFTTLVIFALYATIVSPMIAKMGQSTIFTELLGFEVTAILAGLFARSPMVSLFYGTLWPAVLLTYQLLVDTSASICYELALLTAVTFMLPLLSSFVSVTDKVHISHDYILAGVCLLPAAYQTAKARWTATAEEAKARAQMYARVGSSGFRPSLTGNTEAGLTNPPRRSDAGIELIPAADEEGGRGDPDMREGVGLELIDMSLFLPNGQIILRDISLRIPVGATVAVMGPSGSGKSSITNVLSGRAGYGQVVGDILVNGGNNGVGLQQLRGITGFVPQDDVMHRSLTCLENMKFQAMLRTPSEYRGSARDFATKEAHRILAMLGLGHVANTIIGDESVRGVSGGQRKRVSIGMELVARPSLLFLDEPTSGLDSTTSQLVVELVTRISQENKCTSLAVIHQPRYETLQMFDMLVLLATGGYLVYAGPTDKAIGYFKDKLSLVFPEMSNPSDIFMDAITLDSAKVLSQKKKFDIPGDDDPFEDKDCFGLALANTWKKHAARYQPDAASVVAKLPCLSQTRSSWGEALLAHTQRALLQTRLATSTSFIICVVLLLGVALLGVVVPASGDDPVKVIIQSVIGLFYLCLTQGVAAQRVFGGGERVVAWREAGVQVNMILYFVGRDMAALVDILLYTTVFTGFYWPMCTTQISFHNMFWGVFAYIYAVWGMNFIFSVMVEPPTANMISVVLTFICNLFAGIEPPFGDLVNIGQGRIGCALVALSPLRWALNWFMFNEFKNPSSPFKNELHKVMMGGWLADRGFGAPTEEVGSAPVGELWLQTPPNSFVGGTTQLYMLGFLYRFLALVVSLRIAKKHSKGGGSAIDASEGSTNGLLRFTGGMFMAFIVILFRMELEVILETK
eukprot:TRINITY_DN110974_c0_g1_i1.p1 TRINITY_DN110974_c0_g1~~TRINITY_DN110974_c0_g1_i1.p1  ORF type:complete len:1243 (+),score=129.46 TRINITY_DN110974_c0_g1_i1:79-3807(+)